MTEATLRNVTTYPDREAWLADVTRDGVGATDACRLLGLYPAAWGGPWSVWARYHRPDAIRPQEGAHLRAGLYWEFSALEWYRTHRLDADVTMRSPLCRIEGGLLRPSPDAMITNAEQQIVGLVEVKCPRAGWHAYAPDGHVVEAWGERGINHYPAPLHYCVQVYAQLAAARLAGHPVGWADLLVFFGPQDVRTIRFVADEAHEDQLVERLAQAHAEIVVDGTEPPPDLSVDAWRDLVERPRDADHEADEDLAGMLRQFAAVAAVYRDAGEQRDRLRRDILARANDLGARRLIWDGQRLTISSRGSLTIREIKP
tara:strand:- start:724 stop:1665 length:942 start_codon:yes stop_codon:yes gene_type:complete